ncbi:hypothetical protein HDU91_004782 [Kappamyces sp. JEL0680]|nr:hypothetical protein HDU91_004782 [Kappamyces sp. JEL0680]
MTTVAPNSASSTLPTPSFQFDDGLNEAHHDDAPAAAHRQTDCDDDAFAVLAASCLEAAPYSPSTPLGATEEVVDLGLQVDSSTFSSLDLFCGIAVEVAAQEEEAQTAVATPAIAAAVLVEGKRKRSVVASLDLQASLATVAKKRKYSEARVFACPDCPKAFTQQAHLSIHQRPYVCHYEGCTKSFTQLGNLKTHERKHTGERPFKCSHPGCGKTFSQMGNMKTHEQLHLGIRPFPCTFPGCGKSFTQLGNLKSHQLKVHPAPPAPVDSPSASPTTISSKSNTNSRKFASIPSSSLPPRKRPIPGLVREDDSPVKHELAPSLDLRATTCSPGPEKELEILLAMKALVDKR